MNHQPSGYSVRGSRQRRPHESADPLRPPDLLGRRIPAENGVPYRVTVVVCLNRQRFVEFCAQENLNPRSRQFIVVSGIHDTHKVRGVNDFDVVFLTHCEQMRDFDAVRTEITFRTLTSKTCNIYYLHT